MTPGDQIRAWRNQRRLSLVGVTKLTGIPGSTWSHAERGMPAEPATVERIRAVTGVELPVFVPQPAPKRVKPVIQDADDESDLRGKGCWHCCGMPHRRPQDRPCRCGESWAPDVVEVASGLRSAADWMGDRGGEVEE